MKAKFHKLVMNICVCSKVYLWSVIISIMLASNAIAQENGNSEAEMDQKKYMFELAKNWSFGYENYKNKQYDRAAKYFWIVAKLDTIDKFPRVYSLLGDSYFKLEKPDSAQIVFEMGVEKYPESAHLHRMIGFLKAQREQIDEAIEEYEKVIELEPDSKDDWRQLASLYAKAARDDEAIEAYDKVLEMDPADVESREIQAALLGRTGDIEGLIQKKEEVRTQDPDNSRIRFELGELYYREQQYEKAIDVLKELLALSAEDVAAMEYMANSYRSLEKHDKAIEYFKKILDIQPQNKRVMCEISRSYREIGHFQSARTYANKALAVDGKYGFGWIALGEAYEGSAEKCGEAKGGSVDWDDKLVYELARQHYRRAFQDLGFRQEAERKISFLAGALPTKEDVFMHRTDKRPTSDCYSWIPDSAFGDSFWNALNARLN